MNKAQIEDVLQIDKGITTSELEEIVNAILMGTAGLIAVIHTKAETVAYLLYYPWIYIRRIFTLEEYRKKGIASALLRHCQQIFTRISVDNVIKDGTVYRAMGDLYSRLGFRRDSLSGRLVWEESGFVDFIDRLEQMSRIQKTEQFI
jgi:GNAT superfamily N-acetyltransferase